MSLSPIDRDLLIRTVVGEAAHEPLNGQAGVVFSVLNRMSSGKYGGKDVQSVIFKKNAYEPWSTRRSELLSYKPDDPNYQRAGAIVDAALSGQIKDPTEGKTHFLNADVVRSRRGGSLPDWAQGEGQDIGRHTFFAPDGIVKVADSGPKPVDDPEILKQLGETGSAAATQSPPVASAPVTDPAILQQLNGGSTEESNTALREQLSAPVPIESGKEIGLGTAFVQGFASNEQEALRYVAQQLYPNEPVEQSVKRFGMEGGVLYHTGDDGKRYRALPETLSLQGVGTALASSAGKMLPNLAGMITGAVTAPAAMAGPGGLAASLSLTGGAAGAGEYAREKLGDYMMGDVADNEVSPLQIASEAGSALVGQGAGAGAVALRTRGAARDIARYDATDTAKAYSDAAAQGITLTPAEATGLASLKAQQKRLVNTMETADTMSDFLTRRDAEVRTAWNGYLDSISTAADAETVGKLARDTAGQIFSDMRSALQAKAQPVYDVAYGTVRGPTGTVIGYQRTVPLTPVLEELLQRPVVKDALGKAATMAKNEGVAFNPAAPNMRGWGYIKESLDDILDSSVSMNERTGGRNNYGRIVSGIKRDMLSELDGLVPEYSQARSIYSGGAEDVTTAMQSAMNLLAKTKDTQILNAARHIFDPRSRSPQMVLALRRELEGKNPDAWQAIKRLYMQDVTTDALRIPETGDVLNPAGKIHKAFMNPRVQENLRAAMSDDEWTSMKDLLVVFKRASSVPALRSDTAFNEWARQAERDAAQGPISTVIKNVNPLTALKSVAEWRTTQRMDQNASRIVDLITSGDPEAMKTMKELRRLSPWDRRWTILFGHLLTRTSVAGASSLIPEPDYAPEQASH